MRAAAFLATLLTLCATVSAQQPPIRLAEKWTDPYTGEAATGKHVIALWQFDAGAELRDLSGNGHDLTLNGAKLVPEGRFGGGLQSFRGWPDEDKPHHATARPDPRLSPKGAFTLELWLMPGPELVGYPEAILLDKKYGDHADYQLALGAADSSERRSLRAYLGFGVDSVTFAAEPARYETGVWHHVAFTYDGAGTGRFLRDGVALGGSTAAGRGAICPGRRELHLGDRVGSLYHGFPGVLDQVRLCNGVLEFRPVLLAVSSERSAFVRMEPAAVAVTATNTGTAPLSGARLTLSMGGRAMREVALPELASGASSTSEYPVDTRLRPDRYRLVARVELPGDKPYVSEESFAITIVPRPLPQRFPVMMWGGAGARDRPRLKDLGFTHYMALHCSPDGIWKAGRPASPASNQEALQGTRRELDEALADGLGVLGYLYPGRWARSLAQYRRVDRAGKPYQTATPDICASFPVMKDFCFNVGASIAQAYGTFPGLQIVDLHSEVRGESAPCFHAHDQAAFRQFAGYDIPAEVRSMYGVAYQSLPGFPADRVIPDDYPLYVYYKWLWGPGDGWNALHTALDQGLKSTGRTDITTFFAPAVRAASVWGSGGEADAIAQWSYSYPDPLRVGMDTDELFAMAAGAAKPQQVMTAVQIIWYRSQTAPEPGESAAAQTARFSDKDTRAAGTPAGARPAGYRADWEREQPDARFITIAPMHLREAVWTKLARPVQGMMHHGWESLVETGERGAYRYTHPDTAGELRRLARTLYEPLTPTLMQVPDRKADVAFLESFAAQMLARRGNYGWNSGWAGDVYLTLAYAGLQPEIVYDETIARRGLEGFRVLVMVDCDVITRSMADKILAFQQQGGIVIGDERLTPAVKPEILLPSFERPKEADRARALLQEAAARLRRELDPHYQRYAASSNPDVVTRCRQAGTTDYLFAINDRREFGTYVGHHKLVMENGLPSETTLTLARPAGFAYDLVRSCPLPTTVVAGHLELKSTLGPCDGLLVMVTEREIAGVRLEAPETAPCGSAVGLKLAVVDATGKPVDAVVPLKLELLDPNGRPAERSGYYGAKGGQLTVSADLAPNDVPGLWRLRVTELAAGHTAEAYVKARDLWGAGS